MYQDIQEALRDIRKIENKDEQFKAYREHYKKVNKMAVKAIYDYLDSFDEPRLALSSIRGRLEIDRSSLRYSAVYGKNFSLPQEKLIKFSNKYMQQSCSETLLLEPAIIRLPKAVSVIGKLIQEKKVDYDRCLAYVKSQYKTATYKNELPNLKELDLIRERVLEIATDKSVPPQYICGKNPANGFRSTLNGIIDRSIEKALLQSIAFLAFKTDTAIDYFICEDYTKYTILCCYRGGEKITDEKAVAFISYYTRLPKRYQERVFSFVMDSYLSGGFAKKSKNAVQAK